MASEEQPASVAHEEHEWEAQKQNFYRCYITENMTLRKATVCMIERHEFYASHRQWEKKAKDWQFHKYVSEKQRLRQEAESASAQIIKDRNYRRWELRTKRRSRSVSSSGSAQSTQECRPGRGRQRSTSAATAIGLRSMSSNETRRHSLGQLGEAQLGGQVNGYLQPEVPELQVPSDFDDISAEPYDPIFYDVGVPESSLEALRSSVPPDHFPLEAFRHKPDSDSPIQLQVTRGEPVPEIMVSNYDDLSGPLPMYTGGDSPLTFVIPADALTSSHRPMNESLHLYQQSEGSFEGPSALPGDNDSQGFTMRYDPSLDPSWRNEFSPQDQVQNQSFDPNLYIEDDGSSHMVHPSHEVPHGFVDRRPHYRDNSDATPRAPFDAPYMDPAAEQPNRASASRSSQEDSEDETDVVDISGPDQQGTTLNDFMLKMNEYGKSVRKTVKMFGRANNVNPSEVDKLNKALNNTCVAFSEHMKITLKNLEASHQRIIQGEWEMTGRFRRTVAEQKRQIESYQQVISSQAIDTDQGSASQSHYPAPSDEDQSGVFNGSWQAHP